MSAPAGLPQAAGPDPLAGLRGYHLPEPVSWWPPAPGWWVLAALLLATLLFVTWWLLRRHRRRAAARQAEQELAGLREALKRRGNEPEILRELSKLLRRFALAVFPRRRVAALTGEAWLRFLDEHGGNGRFRDGPGRQLVDAPYRQQGGEAFEQIADLVEDWIRRNREAHAC
jgi:hypothetical protein